MKTEANELTEKHAELIHSEKLKVISHVQREQGEWIINTVMVEGCEVPFRFKRQQGYRDLKGARVNMTYYATKEKVAVFEMDVFNVVRIKVT